MSEAGRDPVWAGLSGAADAAEAEALAARVAAWRGVTVDPERLSVMAAFADADAAGGWIADVLEGGSEVSAVLLPGEGDLDPGTAEEALLGLLGDAGPGELVLPAGLAPPGPLAHWGEEEAPEPAPVAAEPATRLTRPSAAPAGAAATRLTRPSRPPAAAPATRLTAPRSTGAAPAPEPPPAPGADLRPGQVLSHTYEILKLIGRGGMGSVYLARHVDLGSQHAIKVISPEHARDEHIVGLFRREAESLRSVRHDAVIGHEGSIRDETGRLYLVMEYADGPSLAKRLQEGPLAPEEVETLARRIGAGLEAAHDKGIIHRDLSPDNIVLVGGDVARAQIIDFGIARNLEGQGTLIGSQFAGKYSYASPEQLGLFGGHVGRQSDLYSFGLVIAAALGRPINLGRSPAEAAKNRETPVDCSGYPPPWDTRLAALLEPDPRDRPDRYSALVAPEPTGAQGQWTSPRAARAPEPPRRRGGLRIGLAAAVLLAAIGSGAWVMRDTLYGTGDTVETLGAPSATAPEETAAQTGRATPPEDAAPATDRAEGGAPQPEAGPTVPDDSATGGTGIGEADAPAAPSGPQETASGPAAPEQDGVGAGQPGTTVASGPATQAEGDPAPGGTRRPITEIRDEIMSKIAAALPGDACHRVVPLLRFEETGYAVTLTGVAGSAALIEAARAAAAEVEGIGTVRSEVRTVSQPFCPFLALGGPGLSGPAPGIGLNRSDARYREGEQITFTLSARGSGQRFYYLSYVDKDGALAHLLPNSVAARNRLGPGEAITLGAPREGERHNIYRAAPPYGPNLVLAVSSTLPLFGTRRPNGERAEAYIADLRPAIAEVVAAGGEVGVSHIFLETVP